MFLQCSIFCHMVKSVSLSRRQTVQPLLESTLAALGQLHRPALQRHRQEHKSSQPSRMLSATTRPGHPSRGHLSECFKCSSVLDVDLQKPEMRNRLPGKRRIPAVKIQKPCRNRETNMKVHSEYIHNGTYEHYIFMNGNDISN